LPLSEVIHYAQLVIPLGAAVALLLSSARRGRRWVIAWLTLLAIYALISSPVKTPIMWSMPATGLEIVINSLHMWVLLACAALVLVLARWSGEHLDLQSGAR